MKKFRLLLAMSSLLALVCSFTACSTDIDDNYPTITVSVEAGTTTDSSATFTIKANGADDMYYWVYATPAEGAEDYELLIEKGTYLDASVDTPFEQEITVTGLKATTEYNVHVYAKNFAHNAYANPIKFTTGVTPLPAPAPVIKKVLVEEEEVTETSFLAYVTVESAQSAAYLVVPKYTADITAEKVFANGVAITEKLDGEVAVTVEDLNPGTDYEFYVAANNYDVLALSEAVAVTTLVPQTPVVELYFDELMDTKDLADLVGLPGILVQVRNSATGAMANLFMVDYSSAEYPGYLAAGDYPALSGSFDEGTCPEVSCLLADPSYTNFFDGENTYFVVGDVAESDEGIPYCLNVMTAMPESDENLLSFNLPVVDEEGNEYVLQGEYYGPMGYTSGIVAYPFDLKQWGFTNYTATVSGNTVKLKSTSINGDFEMILQTENGQWVDNTFVAGEGGNLTGGFTSFLEGAPETFVFTSGRISFDKGEGENNYVLNVSTRAGDWVMQGETGAYLINAPEEGYAITVTVEAAAEALSIDGKRWQLPADIAEMMTEKSTAVVVADLGVSVAGQLAIAVDYESVYGSQAAGMWAPMVMVGYEVVATDATSGNIVVSSVDHFGDVKQVNAPYSNLTADSVTIDFTNILGMPGTGPCALYTGEVNLSGGGVM
ncbi:MAG: hypothetical protein IKY93_00590 [Alistipes sp.]|nr:hypothetical protein [Alistipes sp.]